MQGKFARIINMISYGFGTAVFILAIHATGSVLQAYTLAQASAAFGIIVGIAQMVVSFLALSTKCTNWVVWVIAHAILILFSLIGASMELAAEAAGCFPRQMQMLPSNPSGSAIYGSTLPRTGPPNDSCAATAYFFGVVFFFDFIFCIVGVILMVLKRAGTVEKGGPAILQAQAENLVQKVSSSLLSKSSKTASATANPSADM